MIVAQDSADPIRDILALAGPDKETLELLGRLGGYSYALETDNYDAAVRGALQELNSNSAKIQQSLGARGAGAQAR
jgi:hypothetical protein